MKHQDAVFGPDTGGSPAIAPQDPRASRTFRELVEQIRKMEPRALTSDQYDDVLTLIDYMRDTTVTLYDRMCTREEDVGRRETDVARRERELDLKLKAFNSALRVRESIGGRLRRYLGR